MKFNIGTLVKVNTDNKFFPIELSDGAVNVFFAATGAAHAFQTYRAYSNGDTFEIALHGIATALSAYWPYMIANNLTHKGLSHMSYGLATMIPNLAPLQAFGTLQALDKIYNLDGIHFPNGKSLFGRGKSINPYGTDNAFTDSYKLPKKWKYIAVTPAYFVGASATQFFLPRFWNQIYGSAIAWGLAAVCGYDIWQPEHK